MVGEILRLGPFIGGQNTASDASMIEDDELIECLNYELDLDGSLINRPAIEVVLEGASDEYLYIFGSVTLGGVLYLFATQDGATFVSSNLGTSWTELNPGAVSRECVTMAVYQNTVWLPATPDSANGGISWTPSGGAAAVAAMPRGSACVVHKNRLYICPGETETVNESRLHFSEAADFTDWPGTDFIDVVQGNGDTLNNVIVYQDNLLLFKGETTHVLAYDLDPVDAILKEVNSVVGAHGNSTVVQHENNVYVMHHSVVYEVVNFAFEPLNLKLPLVVDQTLPVNTDARYNDESLSLLGDRLVVRYFNKTYVFGLRTRTWSEWRKTDETSDVEWHIFGPLVRAHVSTSDHYYTSYAFDMDDASGYKIIRIPDTRVSTILEGFGTHTIHCIATTKDYDMADPVRFKRLFWWGADIVTGRDIYADVVPITFQFSPTFAQLEDLTFAELNTWGSPTMSNLPTLTEVDGDDVYNTSRMVKFNRGLRFRKVNFSVMLESDGTDLQPAKILSFLVIVKTKQKVSAQVS
jgi:hypothetical protein